MKEETLLEQMTRVRPEVIDERDKLREDYYKLEDKYIHNVPCCNEEDCGLFKDYVDLQQRIDKAIEYIKECTSSPDEYENFISTSETKRLLKILGGDVDDE